MTIKQEYKQPDCVDRLVITLNGEVPGPTLRVSPGELVEVTVVNSLDDQAVSMHWHGMRQLATPWQDGASMISGCPIPPNTQWTYRFNANDLPGTYMYHAHLGGQRVAGLGGVLIIEGDVSSYAADVVDDIVMDITDWYHATHQEIFTGLGEARFRWPGDPQSVLINGKGFFNCTDNAMYSCTDDVCADSSGEIAGASARPWHRPSYHPSTCESSLCPGLETFEVMAGSSYLLRLVNTGSLSLFNVAVDGHTLTVVEVDGAPTQPLETDTVDLNSGQRVSVVLSANHSSGTFVIRVKVRARSGVREGHALLKYSADAPDMSGYEAEMVDISQPNWDDNNFTFDFQNSLKGLYEGDTALDAVPTNDEVLRRFVVLNTQERVNLDATSNGQPSFESIQDAIGTGDDRPENHCDSNGNTYELRWLMGRRDWSMPTTPVLSKLFFELGVEDLSEENMYFLVEVGGVYDLVIQNYPACNGVCETHAWHLHSVHSWILGTFRGEYTGSSEQIDDFNLVDPPQRDVVMTVSEGVENTPDDTTGCGYTVLRFRIEAPGAWPFHCHQVFHHKMGSQVLFYTGIDTIPDPPSNLLLCGDMDAQTVATKLFTSTTEECQECNETVCGDLATSSVSCAFFSHIGVFLMIRIFTYGW